MKLAMVKNWLHLLFVLCCIGGTQALAHTKEKQPEIPLTEDLMQEHGVLNRILLIYEEIIKRIDHHTFPVLSLQKAAHLIKTFIEDYHEKHEETYIFPLFEKNKREIKLIKTLRDQHIVGRKITARLQEIAASKKYDSSKMKREARNLLKKFIALYRPHEAREDTVLFPQVRSLMTTKEFDALGEKFENAEHKLFGKEGFEKIVRTVEQIEKELNIYHLERFTPRLRQ